MRLDCDCVVPLGGGSALAVGKGVAVLATNGPDFHGLLKLPSLPQKPLPVMAIPTTAGSGSEVSQFIPLLDEEKKIKEALGGLKLLAGNLRTAATARTVEALDKCLLGSALANMACGNAKLGLVHHLNMFLSAYCPDITYGLGIVVLLPPVMAYNLQASVERFAQLAKALGEVPGNASVREQAGSAVRAVKRLLADLGFPRSFTPQQLAPELIPNIAREAAAAHCVNLRRASVADLEEILRQTLVGWEV